MSHTVSGSRISPVVCVSLGASLENTEENVWWLKNEHLTSAPLGRIDALPLNQSYLPKVPGSDRPRRDYLTLDRLACAYSNFERPGILGLRVAAGRTGRSAAGLC